MRLCCEVEDGVDPISYQALQDLFWIGDISANKREILPAVETSDIVERRAVVQFIEAEDVIRRFVGDREMSHKP